MQLLGSAQGAKLFHMEILYFKDPLRSPWTAEIIYNFQKSLSKT